jgi:hypothetical protein
MLEPTSPTRDGHSVGKFLSLTKATEFSSFFSLIIIIIIIIPSVLAYIRRSRFTVQLASDWLISVQAQVQSQHLPCNICRGKVALGLSFPAWTPVFLCQLHFQQCPTLIYLQGLVQSAHLSLSIYELNFIPLVQLSTFVQTCTESIAMHNVLMSLKYKDKHILAQYR